MPFLGQATARRASARRHTIAASILIGAAGPTPQLDAQPTRPEPLDAIAFLAGGTWRAEGNWPDGSPLAVDVRYTWGPTRRVLHFETYDRSASDRRLLYEGMLFRDPKNGTIAQWNFKPSGDIDMSQITRIDSAGYDVRGANTRSFIRRTGPNDFRWELQVPHDTGWRTILRADYRRLAPAGSAMTPNRRRGTSMMTVALSPNSAFPK